MTATVTKAATGSKVFEQTFADLSFAQLREKSPGLLDYLVGFQVVDVDDDETRAVGIFGAQVGKQWIYLPVFFINGELKGTVLLYLRSQDIFVPNTEGWVNFLINRRPNVLGEGKDQQDADLKGLKDPDFSQLNRSPLSGAVNTGFGAFGKTGSVKLEKWAADAIASFNLHHPSSSRYAGSNLASFLKRAGDWAFRGLASAMKDNHEFGNRVLRFHTTEELFKDAQLRNTKGQYTRPGKYPLSIEGDELDPQVGEDRDLTTIHMVVDKDDEDIAEVLDGPEDAANNPDLTDAERERLLRGEIVIRDHRRNTSKVYKADLGADMFNPDGCGIYSVLLQNGDFQPSLVVYPPTAIGEGTSRVALVVTEDKKNWSYFAPGALWANQEADSPDPEEQRKKFFSGLSSLETIRNGNVYSIIGPNLDGTIAFEVVMKVTGPDGGTELYVQPRTGYETIKATPQDVARDGSLKGPYRGEPAVGAYSGESFAGSGTEKIYPHHESAPVDADERKWRDNEKARNRQSYTQFRHIVIMSDNRFDNLRVVGNTLFVPSHYKALDLPDPSETAEPIWSVNDPATMADLESFLIKNSGFRPLYVVRQGSGFYINDRGPMSKKAALEVLLNDIRVEDAYTAQSLIKNADDNKRKNYWLKQSVSVPGFPEPNTYFDPLLNVQGQYPLSQDMPVDMGGGPDPQDAYNQQAFQPDDFRLAQNAAQSDQREVFDTAVIGSLVRNSNSPSLVGKYLADLIKGEDRIGRILFLLYWHWDQFKERYGQDELPDLEDRLTGVFEDMGELILFLKQDIIEASPGQDALSIELDEG